MPKVAHYTEAERVFVLKLAKVTGRPFTALAPVIRSLAEEGCLSFLGPGACEKFMRWSPSRAYRWAGRYGWDLEAINPQLTDEHLDEWANKMARKMEIAQDDKTPLPSGDAVDDHILRSRLLIERFFKDRIRNNIGDPYQNALAHIRVSDQIESQNVRRNTPQITCDGFVFILVGMLEKYGIFNLPSVDRDTVLCEISNEMRHMMHLPLEANALSG